MLTASNLISKDLELIYQLLLLNKTLSNQIKNFRDIINAQQPKLLDDDLAKLSFGL